MIVPGVRYVPGRNGYSDSDGRKYGIAIHNTSNDATAEGEASYATRRTDGTSSHFYVDDDSVVQSLDTDVRAGHAGSRTGNDNAIAFEITGTNAKSRQWWLDNVAWDKLAQVCAVLCREYGIEPRRASVSEMVNNPQVRAFYGHDDMRRAWGGTTHTDPGGNFPWDHLFAEVKKALAGTTAVEEDDMTPEELRDRDIWPNPYGDKATNPTIALGTAVRNLCRDTDQTLGEVRAVRAGQAAVLAAVQGLDTEAVLAEVRKVGEELPGKILAALPDGSDPVTREELEAALRAVLGSVDNPQS